MGIITTHPVDLMKLRVLFFASVREAVGKREETLELQDEVCTLATVRRALCARYPEAATTIQAITLAKNLEYADDATPVQDGDEVALIPPISGG
ncbi:hypothetical protein Poli38472_014793 [Pythium oligandrum]|uniref:Molybdopterin converting factor subunit 1 n=1 Tax=Pythium oligandrum TaxID=41045 RepID=A0A8K1FMQ2_PYTOL|nr:hypothetical protein Poli38472_014793 [Pythium oligandrum]|eukprot:TMW63883.1 hypothetical protein Poli38472_014793 [Pythium oligandrum]